MFELTVKAHFDAAHYLVDYPGECSRLHGHTYHVEVTVQGQRLNKIGLVYDFKDLKASVKNIISPFDHAYINEISPFDKITPTAENLAKYIFEKLKGSVPPDIKVKSVDIWETPTAKLSYSEE